MEDNIRISRDFNVGQWKNLRKNLFKNNLEDWEGAISIFNDRISSRFLNPINSINNETDFEKRAGEGFSISLILIVLMESLASFEIGKIYTQEKKFSPHLYNSSAKLFNEFLKNNEIFKEKFPNNRDARDLFYKNIRCGLVHEARTKNNDIILSNKSSRTANSNLFYFKENNQYILNRDLFYETLKEFLEKYKNNLRLNCGDLRKKFILKMDEVAGINHSWYFIYGSNLNPKKFDKRLTELETNFLFSIKSELNDFEFVYNKKSIDGTSKGNIKKCLGSKVLGIAVLLDNNSLDLFINKFEVGYKLEQVKINELNSEPFIAYTCISDIITNESPKSNYVNEVISGAEYHQINQDYINKFLKV